MTRVQVRLLEGRPFESSPWSLIRTGQSVVLCRHERNCFWSGWRCYRPLVSMNKINKGFLILRTYGVPARDSSYTTLAFTLNLYNEGSEDAGTVMRTYRDVQSSG